MAIAPKLPQRAPVGSLLPTLGEIIALSHRFEHFAVHFRAAQDGSEAIVAWSRDWQNLWLERVAQCFPQTRPIGACLQLMSEALASESFALASERSCGIPQAPIRHRPEDFANREPGHLFYRHERERPRSFAFKRRMPDSIVNPTFDELCCVLHIHAGLEDSNASMPASLLGIAEAFGRELSSQWGPFGCVETRFKHANSAITESLSDTRASSAFKSALHSAIDKAELLAQKTPAQGGSRQSARI